MVIVVIIVFDKAPPVDIDHVSSCTEARRKSKPHTRWPNVVLILLAISFSLHTQSGNVANLLSVSIAAHYAVATTGDFRVSAWQ